MDDRARIGAGESEIPVSTVGSDPEPATRSRANCVYVIDGEEFDAPRYCDAPAVPGSAYCATHRALCGVAPDSREGVRLLRELELAAETALPLPPGFAGLVCAPVPEPWGEDDPREIAALLDWRPERTTDLD